MPRKPIGVVASRGRLTYYLDELGLTRKDLSGMVGVSVRTIHNIEHGRRRVDRGLLQRVAIVLNQVAQEQGHRPPLALTENNFIRDPDAAAEVFLRSILVNDCSMMFAGDTPIASPDLRWVAPGQRDSIPFAGHYEGARVFKLIENLHASVQLDGLEGVEFLRNRTESILIVRAIVNFRHRGSAAMLRFKSFSELHLIDGTLTFVDTVYDETRMKEFLLSGVPPKRKKSER